jgi:O-acetyl-ADP-ribose deacetylase (regulator of RNase III)
MTTIKMMKGDATCPQGSGTKIIAHVVNDSGKWGKGFVMALSKKWPETREAYLAWHKSKKLFELGQTAFQTINVAPVQYVVAHMIAQRGIQGRSNPVPLRYKHLRACLKHVAYRAQQWGPGTQWYQPVSVHMPKIGCGLAGGKWDKVEPIIQEELCDHGIAVVVYTLD